MNQTFAKRGTIYWDVLLSYASRPPRERRSMWFSRYDVIDVTLGDIRAGPQFLPILLHRSSHLQAIFIFILTVSCLWSYFSLYILVISARYGLYYIEYCIVWTRVTYAIRGQFTEMWYWVMLLVHLLERRSMCPDAHSRSNRHVIVRSDSPVQLPYSSI